MKYHLQQFDRSVNDNTVHGIEVGEIIDEIKHSAFSIRSEHELKLFIQNHQKILIKFKNHKPIGHLADQVLYFLETHFPDAVNEQLQASNMAKQEVWLRHAENILHFRPKVKAAITVKLYRCIQPIMEPEKTVKLSIYHLKYIESFWYHWPMLPQSTIDHEKVILYLISQNFNPSHFFRYITRGIIAELAHEDSASFQKQILISYKRKLGTVLAKLTHPFCHDNTAIQPVLEVWLETQLELCTIIANNLDVDKQGKALASHYKIETSLSVAQTAYFFKLLYKSGIITNKTQTDMLHTVSEKFRSVKAENISYESLHKKYYNVEDHAKEAIQEVVKTLLKNIKSIQ